MPRKLFKKGDPRPAGAGRKPGSINKRQRTILETAERVGCDPFEILLLFAKGDWEALGYKSEKVTVSISDAGIVEKYTIDPNTRAKCASEAVQYIVPKLKSIEHKQSNIYEGMEPEQKLEMLRDAVKALEDSIVRSGPPAIRDVSQDPGADKP